MTEKTKRLYFDCPIRAAYMAKEFGIKCYLEGKNFYSCAYEIEIFNKGVNGWKRQLRTDGTWNQDLVDDGKQQYLKQPSGWDHKIYVAPESEDLFKPKKGDIGLSEDWPQFPVISTEPLPDWPKVQWVHGPVVIQDAEIIMRDNKQFFSAKEEV